MEMAKRLKRSRVDEIDRISELPESVLLHILSFLDMKEVVRTSVLSKKWEYIWTSVPTLTFKFNSQEKEELRPFIMWINKTLFQCQNNTGRKFHVKFRYMEEFAGDVDLWAKFVARNNIQDMTLDVSGIGVNDSYKLSRSLCQNSSLSSLSISNCTVALGGEICWTSLRSLSIAFMRFDDYIMTKILSATPMLQVLKISYSRIRKVLHINSNSLRELMIDTFVGGSLIEISAPNVQSLRILGLLFLGKFHLYSSSLFRAELDFRFDYFDSEKEQCRSDFMTIIESILPVVQLEVGFYSHEYLLLLGNNNSLSSPFSRLTCLKLTGIMDKTDIVGIICLLKCSPNLEKLVLNKQGLPNSKFYSRNKSLEKLAGEYWESERRVEKIELPSLKTVKFNGFKEVNEFTSVLLQLLRENAVLLDNIVIHLGDLPMIVMPKPKPRVA